MALLFGAEIDDVLADFRKHKSPAAAMLAAETDPEAKGPLSKSPDQASSAS